MTLIQVGVLLSLALLLQGAVGVGIVNYDGHDVEYPHAHHRHVMRGAHHANNAARHMLNGKKHPVLSSAVAGPQSMAAGEAQATSLRVLANVAALHPEEEQFKEVPAAAEAQEPSMASALYEKDKKMVDRLGKMVKHLIFAEQNVEDPKAFHDMMRELDEMESLLKLSGREEPKLMGAIDAMRAEMCAHQGYDSSQYDECVKFMEKVCNPGSDGLMDGDSGEYTTAKGYCKQFFPEEAPAGAPKPAPAPAPAPKAEEVKEAPAAAPAATPAAPAPAAAPAMERPLPEQGFEGPLVEHNDKKTATSDWRKEFGPQGPNHTYKSVCAEHPDNEWCIRNGHVGAAVRTQAPSSSSLGSVLLPACVLLGLLYQLQ